MKNISETVKCEHTPGPWAIRDIPKGVQVTPADNPYFVIAGVSGFDTHEREANARFIVTACNAHDVLLDACKWAEKLMSQTECTGEKSLGNGQCLDAIRHAISLATNT